MTTLSDKVLVWAELAERKLLGGEFGEFDLRVLRQIVADDGATTQRILFLFARDRMLNSPIVAWNDPLQPQGSAMSTERPYATVIAAIADGWQILQIGPVPLAEPQNGAVGTEFVLHRPRGLP